MGIFVIGAAYLWLTGVVGSGLSSRLADLDKSIVEGSTDAAKLVALCSEGVQKINEYGQNLARQMESSLIPSLAVTRRYLDSVYLSEATADAFHKKMQDFLATQKAELLRTVTTVYTAVQVMEQTFEQDFAASCQQEGRHKSGSAFLQTDVLEWSGQIDRTDQHRRFLQGKMQLLQKSLAGTEAAVAQLTSMKQGVQEFLAQEWQPGWMQLADLALSRADMVKDERRKNGVSGLFEEKLDQLHKEVAIVGEIWTAANSERRVEGGNFLKCRALDVESSSMGILLTLTPVNQQGAPDVSSSFSGALPALQNPLWAFIQKLCSPNFSCCVDTDSAA